MHGMMLSAVIRRDGRSYSAWNPELDIASEGKTPEDALAALKEAVELYLEDEDAQLPVGTPLFASFEVEHGKDASPVGA
ncbi:MAG: type II toxin-antitoxin system HicB family antitoxin [Thermoplasmatota archaeon]|nr:type II toxin-antitoxin system HicB family antitoxin [Halobacteriales archaeon]